MKYTRLCIVFIVVAITSALWSQPLLSPSFSLLSVVPCTSLCVTLSVIPHWKSLHGGRGGWTNRAPLHWGETERKTRWRGGGGGGERFTSGSTLLVDLMRRRGRKTGGGMLFLSPHSANKTPHALCALPGPQPEAAGGEEEMLSVPEFAPLRRCLGTGGGHRKKPLSSPFSGRRYGSEGNKGSQFIHYTGNMSKWGPLCGAAAAPCRWTRREWG